VCMSVCVRVCINIAVSRSFFTQYTHAHTQAAREISTIMSSSNSNLYLDSESLLLNTAGLGGAMGVRMTK
jgi:hypothetical protein